MKSYRNEKDDSSSKTLEKLERKIYIVTEEKNFFKIKKLEEKINDFEGKSLESERKVKENENNPRLKLNNYSQNGIKEENFSSKISDLEKKIDNLSYKLESFLRDSERKEIKYGILEKKIETLESKLILRGENTLNAERIKILAKTWSRQNVSTLSFSEFKDVIFKEISSIYSGLANQDEIILKTHETENKRENSFRFMKNYVEDKKNNNNEELDISFKNNRLSFDYSMKEDRNYKERINTNINQKLNYEEENAYKKSSVINLENKYLERNRKSHSFYLKEEKDKDYSYEKDDRRKKIDQEIDKRVNLELEKRQKIVNSYKNSKKTDDNSEEDQFKFTPFSTERSRNKEISGRLILEKKMKEDKINKFAENIKYKPN